MAEERNTGVSPAPPSQGSEETPGPKRSEIGRAENTEKMEESDAETEDPDLVYTPEEEEIYSANKPSVPGSITSGEKLP